MGELFHPSSIDSMIEAKRTCGVRSINKILDYVASLERIWAWGLNSAHHNFLSTFVMSPLLACVFHMGKYIWKINAWGRIDIGVGDQES